MKFTCNREALDKQLQYVSRVVTIRHTLPILSNLLLETDEEKISISGTDLELAIATHVAADIEQQGSFTVPAKLFQDFIHQNPDHEITFSLESSELVCRSEQVEARIPGIDADEYPALPNVEEKNRIALDTKTFIDALKQTVIACAGDPGRPVLTGVLCTLDVDALTLAATDSFRLVERRLPAVAVASPITILIPMRTVQELIRIIGQVGEQEALALTMSDQQAVFHVSGVELYSRLLTGTFPKYQAIIPQNFVATVPVMTQEFMQSLRLTSIFSQAGISNVMLEVQADGSLTMSSYGTQRGGAKNTLAAKAEAGFTALKCALNAKFLLDACGATGSEQIRLKFSGATSPLVIETDDTNYLQLVMPIRVD